MATTGRCNFKYSLCISGPWLLEQITMKSVVKHLRLGMYNLITQEVLSPKLASLPGLTQGINCSKNTRKKSVSLFLKPLFFIPSSFVGSVLQARCTSPHATVTLPLAPMLTSFSSLPPSPSCQKPLCLLTALLETPRSLVTPTESSVQFKVP